MFGEGAISSPKSLAPSKFGVPKCGDPEIVFSFRMLWTGEGSLLKFRFGILPHKIDMVRGSLVDAAREGGAHKAPVLCNPKQGLARSETSAPYPAL